MAMPKAQLTLNEEAKEIGFQIPCPCGRNGLFTGSLLLGLRDYSVAGSPEGCSACNRVCTLVITVQNDALQKVIRFEYHYNTISDPDYWAAHARMENGCAAMLGHEQVEFPKRLPDKAIIQSATFSCWWENRLGLIPALVFQQNLPMGD
jgi:hypothetical protein